MRTPPYIILVGIVIIIRTELTIFYEGFAKAYGAIIPPCGGGCNIAGEVKVGADEIRARPRDVRVRANSSRSPTSSNCGSGAIRDLARPSRGARQAGSTGSPSQARPPIRPGNLE